MLIKRASEKSEWFAWHPVYADEGADAPAGIVWLETVWVRYDEHGLGKKYYVRLDQFPQLAPPRGEPDQFGGPGVLTACTCPDNPSGAHYRDCRLFIPGSRYLPGPPWR